MKQKNYKIGELYQKDRYVPFIRLSGKWLEELNFNISEQVTVYQGKNMLLIIKPTKNK